MNRSNAAGVAIGIIVIVLAKACTRIYHRTRR